MVAGKGPTIVVVADGDRQVASWPLDPPPQLDLAAVEAVALLALAVRRCGWSLRVVDPCPRLAELLDLVGLADLAAHPGTELPALALEVRREPEGVEELGIEEVVEARDPPV